MFFGSSWNGARMRARVNTAKNKTVAKRTIGRISLDLAHRQFSFFFFFFADREGIDQEQTILSAIFKISSW